MATQVGNPPLIITGHRTSVLILILNPLHLNPILDGMVHLFTLYRLSVSALVLLAPVHPTQQRKLWPVQFVLNSNHYTGLNMYF